VITIHTFETINQPSCLALKEWAAHIPFHSQQRNMFMSQILHKDSHHTRQRGQSFMENWQQCMVPHV